MKRFVLAAVFFAFASHALAARAADVPDAATIRERVAAAAGAKPKIERIRETYTASGLAGTHEIVRLNDDERETWTYGPFHSESGTLRGQEWHQNRNGQTVMDEPDPGRAERDTFQTTVAAIATPVAGYVISNLNARGLGSKQYVDAATWRVVRRDDIEAAWTTVIAYDDFRTVAGYTRAWHWSERDGHPENDADYRIESDDVGAVTAADVAIPGSRRELVEFPAGTSSVELPVREDRGAFIVRVQVGGRGLDFGLDTGASSIVIDDDVARELGLKSYASHSNAANAGRVTSSSTIVPEMKVGTLAMHDVVVHTIPHVGADGGTYRVVGLLGFDFIASLVLKLDYEKGRVTAFDSGAFAPPQDPLTNAVAVRLGGGSPATDVTVNGALGERFILDTGAAGGLMIFDSFSRRHPEATAGRDAIPVGRREYEGVGGSFDTQRYRLSAVKLGRVLFKDFTADVVESKSAYGGSGDGLIGSNFLRLYTVYTDYVDSTIYFVPNADGRFSLQRR